EYVLEINMMLSDGLVLHSKSPIAILAGPPGENVGLKESFRIGDQQGNIYTEPYRATEYGLPCGANVKIIPGISNGRINTCLKKPIIFVEGIDFGFQNHPSGCYGG